MPFTGDLFIHLFDWEKDPQRQEKIINARLEAELDGIDAGLSAVAARTTVVENAVATGVADDSITNAKLANMTQSTLKGRAAGSGTGDPTDLTPAQVRSVIQLDGLTNISGASGTLDLTGGQIKFPATQNPSGNVNTLDDYEEGTFTVTLNFNTNGNLSVGYAARGGSYTKIGNRTYFDFFALTSTFTHTTASGNFYVGTLPFPVANFGIVTPVWQGFTLDAGYTDVNCNVGEPPSLQISWAECGSTKARQFLTNTNVPSGGTVHIRCAGNYW